MVDSEKAGEFTTFHPLKLYLREALLEKVPLQSCLVFVEKNG